MTAVKTDFWNSGPSEEWASTKVTTTVNLGKKMYTL